MAAAGVLPSYRDSHESVAFGATKFLHKGKAPLPVLRKSNSSRAPCRLTNRTLKKSNSERTHRPMVGTTATVAEDVAKSLGSDLEAAVEAVRLASKLCQRVQQALRDAEKVEKEDTSPVTVADYGAQAIVAWALSRQSGGPISLVAEEDSADLRAPESASMRLRITELVNEVISGVPDSVPLTTEEVLRLIDLGNSDGGAEGSHWVLDPIDGTRGFVGMRQYAVCLGLIQNGEVVLGVLGCPNLPQTRVTVNDGKAGAVTRTQDEGVGCLFSAVKGGGAKMGSLWSSDLPSEDISVRDETDMSQVVFMESYDARHSNHELSAAVAEHLGVTQEPLRMDSQVKYGALSRGDACLFMRFPPGYYREKIWDHCAGYVILQEAGGKVTDASGNPLDFSKGRYLDLDSGIVAGPPTAHKKVLEALQAIKQ